VQSFSKQELNGEVKMPKIAMTKIGSSWNNHFFLAIIRILEPIGIGKIFAILPSNLETVNKI
jgi:hypothetical protein